MAWKKLKVDRGWPETWERTATRDDGSKVFAVVERGNDGRFRWGWTNRHGSDPINGWSRSTTPGARAAFAQANDHLRFIAGRGGTLHGTSFAQLARDAAAAARQGNCGTARALASRMRIVARTDKERSAVMKVQGKVRSCKITPGLGRSRRRRRK